MFSFAYSKYANTLKALYEIDSTLIYFICILNNKREYNLNPLIFPNIELICRELNNYDIVKYKRPRNRPSHDVICPLSGYGRKISQELIDLNFCKKMSKLLAGIKNKEDYIRIFNENFTFSEDPNKLILNKLKEFKEKYNLFLAPPNHKFFIDDHEFIIKYAFLNDIFHAKIIIKCSCYKETTKLICEKTLIDNHYGNKNYPIKCNYCKNTFYINHELRRGT